MHRTEPMFYTGGQNISARFKMAYRNKTYVCFDADTDIHYYRLMQAWCENESFNFAFHNAHDLNNLLPTSSEETIKRKLRERLQNTKIFVVLIGEHTRNLHRFVRWEMEQALKLEIPIIAVNLNKKRRMDNDRCPPIIRDELAIHIPFGPVIIQYALENWPASHKTHRQNGDTGAHYYLDSVYKQLGL